MSEIAQAGTKTLTRPESKTKKPSMFKVLLLNDDYTPMDFVVLVLMRFFSKSETEAAEIMLKVHHEGAGLAGVYSREIAESKCAQVNAFAHQNRHPLRSVIEKAD